MTQWCTAKARTRLASSSLPSPSGWRRSVWSCIPTRPASCTARTRTATARHEHEQFTFLGYTFRPRLSKNKHGKHFVNFSPAVSDDARKAISREIRSWHITRRSDKTLTDLARMFNPIVQGWINYYGRFYKSWLYPVLRHINDGLVRWAMRKYKRLHGHTRQSEGMAGESRQTSARPSSPTGSSCDPTAGRWEPDERRRSRPVLREPGGGGSPRPLTLWSWSAAPASTSKRCGKRWRP